LSLNQPEPAIGASPVGVGVVGLGYWGPNLLRVLADDAAVTVKWICDSDRERLARFHRRYPATRPTTEFEDVLADPEVEAVVIATPVFTHYELAAASLAAEKHTFVEKPLAPSALLSDRLIDLARGADRVLMCGQTFLYSPPVRAVKQMVEDGTLGELYFVSSSRVNLGPYRRDISVVWDLAPHDFSILLYWFGETPVTLRATGRAALSTGIADVAFISLTFGSGIVGSVELSWLAPSKLRRTVVVGSKKMVVYDDGIAEPVKIFDHGVVYRDPETFGEHHLSYRTGDILSPKVGAEEPLELELEDFMDAIRHGTTPVASVRLARDVVRVTEAADESLRQRGEELQIAGGRFRRSPVGVELASGW
jgi:predicted dehydrogenase